MYAKFDEYLFKWRQTFLGQISVLFFFLKEPKKKKENTTNQIKKLRETIFYLF